MKIKSLKNYGIPSYILNIWENHYSPCLLPIQEEAVKDYGILENEGGMDSRVRGNDIKESGNDRGNNNLLVIAPPSSGKTFIGEMAAVAQAIHQRKIIYLVPLRSLVEEKYRHFKDLYSNCGIDIAISTRDRREDDHRIIRGDYKMAVMAYEKFNYFLLQYPHFLDDISLVIIDEMQMINAPKWGPLLKEILEQLLQRNLATLKIIALSAFVEEQKALLKWFPARTLISYQPPVELRKGMVRGGVFKYITSKKKNIYQREVFFKPESVRDNCFEDYLLETVRYLINQDGPTLAFFATCADTRKYSRWLACRLESPAASSAIGELKEMEETLSREELLELLEKGIAYHNQDLSWEERNLVETYLKKGEIKIVCATNCRYRKYGRKSRDIRVWQGNFFSLFPCFGNRLSEYLF
jgi:helicase